MRLHEVTADILLEYVLPHLSLHDLASLAPTCRDLRAVANAAPDAYFRSAARRELPVSHPVHRAPDIRGFLRQQQALDAVLSSGPEYSQQQCDTHFWGLASPDGTRFAARAKQRSEARIVDLQTGQGLTVVNLLRVPHVSADAVRDWRWHHDNLHILVPFGAVWGAPSSPEDPSSDETPPHTPSSQAATSADSSTCEQSYSGCSGVLWLDSGLGTFDAILLDVAYPQYVPRVLGELCMGRVLVLHDNAQGQRVLSAVDAPTGAVRSLVAPVRQGPQAFDEHTAHSQIKLSPGGQLVVIDLQPAAAGVLMPVQIWSFELDTMVQQVSLLRSVSGVHWCSSDDAVLCVVSGGLIVWTLTGLVGSLLQLDVEPESVTWGMAGITCLGRQHAGSAHFLHLYKVSASGDLENARAFDVPGYTLQYRTVAQSPSGRHVLVSAVTDGWDPDCPDTLVLLGVRDGTLCCEVVTDFEPGRGRWASDSSAYLVRRCSSEDDYCHTILQVRFG